MKEVIEAVLYCDASVKGGFCGIGICLLDRDGKLLEKQSRRVGSTGKNNTAAEGLAIIEGIKLAKRNGFKHIRIYTDSKALVEVANHNRASTNTTRQFLRALRALCQSIRLSLRWVRGHAGHHWNCLCDRLAREAKWQTSDIFTIVWNRLKGHWDSPGALV